MVIGACRAGLAQLVEQRFCKPKVAGSNPASGTTRLQVIAAVGRLAYVARMLSTLLRLALLIALAVMPMGMATASPAPSGSASAASGHCDDRQKPAETPDMPKMHCAACAALPALDVPLSVAEVQPQPAMTVVAERWTVEPGPETATPPPKLS